MQKFDNGKDSKFLVEGGQLWNVLFKVNEDQYIVSDNFGVWYFFEAQSGTNSDILNEYFPRIKHMVEEWLHEPSYFDVLKPLQDKVADPGELTEVILGLDENSFQPMSKLEDLIKRYDPEAYENMNLEDDNFNMAKLGFEKLLLLIRNFTVPMSRLSLTHNLKDLEVVAEEVHSFYPGSSFDDDIYFDGISLDDLIILPPEDALEVKLRGGSGRDLFLNSHGQIWAPVSCLESSTDIMRKWCLLASL